MLQSNALIVDTSTSIRKYVREVLHQKLGFNVIHEAKDADGAFRVLNSGRAIDWIFTSLEMPGLPPRDLLGTARNGPNGKHTRFVLMSSEDEIVTREIAMLEGAADYLCKPFSPNQLTSVVHRITGLTEQRGAERFKVALPCEINIGFDSFHQYGAELAEISMTGCRMKISQVKPGSGHVNDYATVTLLPENDFSFDAHARIKRVEFSKSCADPLHNTEVTIEFVDVTPPLKEKLEAFIASCKEKSTAKWQQ
ncbi:MAG TPA: response regulator [Gallionellaceae bacterium]|nr:response regulator [Gallionellaceae bacterium]